VNAKRKTSEVQVYDTTLRDGCQSEHVAFSLWDKLDIASRLDDLGVHYIEGGYPGSNPKDLEFFREARALKLGRAKLAAFGATRHAKSKVATDPGIRALIAAGTSAVTLFGKAWDLHVRDALRVSLEENLRMVRDSVHYLKYHVDEVLFDAEHFFDGFRADETYALRVLEAAAEAGADLLVLCETNGGRLPEEVAAAVSTVRARFDVPLGIHTHNDAGLAVANSLAAVRAGCRHVQGTINGLGERCGNADLAVLVPDLELKMDLAAIGRENLAKLTRVSRCAYEIANQNLRDNQPYVGRSAFAHKGGMHVSGVRRNPATYEHVPPASVGNARRVLVSELSGRSNIAAVMGERFGLKKDPAKMRAVLERVQQLEHEGYQFEAAEASLELLVRKLTGAYKPAFELLDFRVTIDVAGDGRESSVGTVKLRVDGTVEHTAGEGNGPVNALDEALRKALEKFYPSLREVSLLDYKVRIINAKAATAARTCVMIESGDRDGRWTTVGVSDNIIAASWIALVDSIEYKLLKDASRRGRRPDRRKKAPARKAGKAKKARPRRKAKKGKRS